jgi:hypothetical protein
MKATHYETVKVCLHLDGDVHVGMERSLHAEYSADESVFGDFDLTIVAEDGGFT